MIRQALPTFLAALFVVPLASAQAPAKEAGRPQAETGPPKSETGRSKTEIAPKTKPPTEEEKRREVEKQYDQALNIYGSIVGKADRAEIAGLKKRIETNENLLKSHREKLTKAEAQRRQFHINYVNRSLGLQRARDKGDLHEKQFQDLVKKEKKQYERQTSALDGDIKLYREETARAEQTLKRLRVEVKQLEASLAHKVRFEEKGKPGATSPVAAIRARLKDLSGFKTIHPTSHSLDCPECAKAFAAEARARRGWLAFLRPGPSAKTRAKTQTPPAPAPKKQP